ncbi:hypothetical protein ACSNOI_43770 [Actinomadura kijaniata]|uniref:hypothetical protein n=1 Tax=Actinomadura kijaniata TaxID=46161 RepID=UPI003F1AB49E
MRVTLSRVAATLAGSAVVSVALLPVADATQAAPLDRALPAASQAGAIPALAPQAQADPEDEAVDELDAFDVNQ